MDLQGEDSNNLMFTNDDDDDDDDDIMAEEDYDDDREARIFTSGGSLNLNSTFLTAAGEPHLVNGHDHFSNNECDGRKEKGCHVTNLF